MLLPSQLPGPPVPGGGGTQGLSRSGLVTLGCDFRLPGRAGLQRTGCPRAGQLWPSVLCSSHRFRPGPSPSAQRGGLWQGCGCLRLGPLTMPTCPIYRGCPDRKEGVELCQRALRAGEGRCRAVPGPHGRAQPRPTGPAAMHPGRPQHLRGRSWPHVHVPSPAPSLCPDRWTCRPATDSTDLSGEAASPREVTSGS